MKREVSVIYLNVFSQGDVQGMGEVMVEFEEAPLTSAISKFGSVQLPERITHHSSPVIPTRYVFSY